MEKTLAVINQLEQEGLIGRYAIGGAVAATRYIEPVQTGEAIVVEDWPVQFLPVYDELTEEALTNALEVNFGSTPTRVLSAEHLAAIMLNTGRPKDHARLLQFFELNALNRATLEETVARHGLTPKWADFRRRFLNEPE